MFEKSERLTGVVDHTVRMEFSANTQAYALVISDRMLNCLIIGVIFN